MRFPCRLQAFDRQGVGAGHDHEAVIGTRIDCRLDPVDHFLLGLLPVIGNLMSNTLITIVGLSLSIWVAVAAQALSRPRCRCTRGSCRHRFM